MGGLRFRSQRAALEEEGVCIGGWSLRHVLTPKKKRCLNSDSASDIEEKPAVKPEWTTEEETKLRRKLDRRLLLPCCMIFFLSILDRANLGNVKILRQGTPDSLGASLGLHGTQFNWAVAMTSFPVLALLIPSNLLMKKISAKWYFPCAMVLWGAVVMSFAAIKSAGGLYAARFMLGIPEAGVPPGIFMYFSFWYKPSERAFRIGLIHSAGSLAAACSGFLALAIDHINGVGGLKAWQWVFLIEGALPILFAPLMWACLLTFPEDSKALTDRERYIAINRFGRGSTRCTDVTWSWPAFRRMFTRPSTYAFFVSYISLSIVSSAQGVFLPTFLSTFLHFSVSKSNIYSAICKLSIVPLYCFYGLHSDWTYERMWHYIVPVMIALPRYATWTYASSHPGHGISALSLYGLSFLGQMVQLGSPILLSYRTTTLYGACEQAVGGAATMASGCIANILAPLLYPEQDAPGFLPGFSATCGLLVTCLVSYVTLPIWLEWEAADRKEKCGHSLPLQALADDEHAQILDTDHARTRTSSVPSEGTNLEKYDSTAKKTERGI